MTHILSRPSHERRTDGNNGFSPAGNRFLCHLFYSSTKNLVDSEKHLVSFLAYVVLSSAICCSFIGMSPFEHRWFSESTRCG